MSSLTGGFGPTWDRCLGRGRQLFLRVAKSAGRIVGLERLAVDPPGWNCPATEHERQVCGGAAEWQAYSVGPVKVGGLESSAFDGGAEVCVDAPFGEVVEDDPDGG